VITIAAPLVTRILRCPLANVVGDQGDNLVAKLVQPLNFLLLHVKLLIERRGFRSVRGIQQPMLVYRYRFEITLHLLTRGWSWHPTNHCQSHL
jgi:hypothetical protein